MHYLTENDYTVIGLADLQKYLNVSDIDDLMLDYRYFYKEESSY